MTMTPSRWAFALSVLLALVTMAFPLALFGQPPEPAAPLHDGFRTPILAFEFATRAEHLAFLEGEAGAEMRAHMHHVQFLDWFFPVAYAGMAVAFFLGLALRGNFLALIGIPLALGTILADWQENTTMNAILAEMDTPYCSADVRPAREDGDVVLRDCLPESAFANASPALDLASYALDSFIPVKVEFLREDTWIKWGLIGGYASLMALLMWFGRWRFLAIPPALAALSLLALRVSGSNGLAAEIMALLLIPFMLTFPVAAVMYFLVTPKGRRKTRARKPQVEGNP
jgi:hypothetical protein